MTSLLVSKARYAKKQLFAFLVIAMMVVLTILLTITTLVYVAALIGVAAVVYLAVISYLKSKINAAVKRYQIYKARIHRVVSGASGLSEAQLLHVDMQQPFENNLDEALVGLIEKNYLAVKRAVLNLTKLDYCVRLSRMASRQKCESDRLLDEQITSHPLTKIKIGLREGLAKLRERKEELQVKWDQQYEKLSWWGKFSSMDGPDFSQLNEHINQLSAMQDQFENKYDPILDKLKRSVTEKKQRARNRIDADQYSAKQFVNDQEHISDVEKHQPDYMLKVVGWCGVFGLGHSLWSDFMTTHAVYDALRGVNGNFASLSDSEIWYETLWMSDASLVGLTSLTKGAYLEQLVANDTGGELFEHFNNPGTDITIGGVEYQIKATDSVEYIETVDEGIPVIATSEVAELTNSIDAGITNAEITEDVALALGGTGVDVVDGMADGVLAGLGGLGTFATLRGIYAANKLYEAGTPGEEAVFAGVGVAVKGTAKALVDISEMVYKVASSRPSRFVARSIYKLGCKVIR